MVAFIFLAFGAHLCFLIFGIALTTPAGRLFNARYLLIAICGLVVASGISAGAVTYVSGRYGWPLFFALTIGILIIMYIRRVIVAARSQWYVIPPMAVLFGWAMIMNFAMTGYCFMGACV